MPTVQVRPSRDLRNKYPEISSIVKQHSPVIITNHGKGDTVLISMEDYAGYEAYMHRCYVLAELKKTDEAMKEPNAKWYSHEEAWEAIRGESDV
ncbi:MAG: type II toxin-antitoxin system Phd/YefM family antitoxin [Defluviitaleaceae bacterium]|nr:type II toxin-antitoxin system Phd/YefM family antitoxin [Defluviitaleaceae bacterium]